MIRLITAFILFCYLSVNLNYGQQNLRCVTDRCDRRTDMPLFGFDILINDQTEQNQKNVSLASSFNGWLYAGYSYFDTLMNRDIYIVMQSKNNGLDWSEFLSGNIGVQNTRILKIDIAVGGNDTTNMKLFLCFIGQNIITGGTTLHVQRYNAYNGSPEEEILGVNEVRDMSIATDAIYQAGGSNPFSMALIYSQNNGPNDIYYCSSNNGGLSITYSVKLASLAPKFPESVAIAYGRSLSNPDGKYFVAWEEKDSETSPFGHFYTAHTQATISGPLTMPVLLGGLDTSLFNRIRHPAIACQQGYSDNDSSDLTEVIVYEKYNTVSQIIEISGSVNNRASSSNNFRSFTVNNSNNIRTRPDLGYNPYDSTFILTYYDSTELRLPYLTHEYNMVMADEWSVRSAGYNDAFGLIDPKPCIAMDWGTRSGANAWSGVREGGLRSAYFDAPFIYYTAVEKLTPKYDGRIRLWPNPARKFVDIDFWAPVGRKVTLSLTDIRGKVMCNKTINRYDPAFLPERIFLNGLSSGLYTVTIRHGSIGLASELLIIE